MKLVWKLAALFAALFITPAMARFTMRQRDSVKVDRLFVSPNAFGDTWYVDGTNGAAANSGQDPKSAFSTLTLARAASVAGDIIVIAPGTYTQTAAAEPLTPKANQLWRAAIDNGLATPTVIITGTAEAVVVDVAVSGVVFQGIKFQADDDAVSELVRVAEGAAVDGVTFLNCWFDGNTKATVNGISADHATQAMTGAWIKACRFVLCNVGIDVGVSGMPNSTIEDCAFDMQDGGGGDVGIALADTTALATGYGFLIRNNDFLGAIDAGRDSLGITIAGTQDTVGMGSIRGNFFSNCTVTPITQNKLNEAIINNYVGDTATGGTLVDPGA